MRSIADILFTQGFGSRRQCLALIASGVVCVRGEVITDPDAFFETQDLTFEVAGVLRRYQDKILIALHKPAGYECSVKPSSHPSVLRLLPADFVTRGVQPVGRLDEDTTGLLLLTDDGELNHVLTHPKRHVPKTYEVCLAHDATPAFLAKLEEGVVLRDDPHPVRALKVSLLDAKTIEVVIDFGRYHVVKRLIAAAGNRCVGLKRTGFGAFRLPADLASGKWRVIDPKVIFAP